MRPTTKLGEWEWIESYLDRLLPPNETQEFEQVLTDDSQFRETVGQLRRAHNALHELAIEQTIRKTVQHQLRRETHGFRFDSTRTTARWVALSMLGGLLFVSYLLTSEVTMTGYQNDIKFTERYRQQTNRDTAEWTPRQKQFYRDFFDGQAYLVAGQPGLAIPYFERLQKMPGARPYFRQAVLWHLINAYLQNKQPDNAASIYQRLMEMPSQTYPIQLLDRWKVWWQLKWYQWTN